MQVHAQLIIAPSLPAAALPDEVAIQSADVAHVVVDRFGIDDARRLTERAATRPVAAPHRTFVVSCAALTPEAQNALLKLFEDPPQDVQFILIVPHESMIIPTLRSRFVDVVTVEQGRGENGAESFLRASYAERLAQIAVLHTRKDTAGMEALTRDVVQAVVRSGAADAAMLSAAAFVESRIRIKGGSRKMLLEHLALSISENGTLQE